MESVDFLASCTSIYSIGRARKKLLLSCSNPRPDSCLGKISRRACSFLDESLAWVLTEVALLRIYNMCMQQPADFRHFTEACEVDSHVSRRFTTIHLKNRRTLTQFTTGSLTCPDRCALCPARNASSRAGVSARKPRSHLAQKRPAIGRTRPKGTPRWVYIPGFQRLTRN